MRITIILTAVVALTACNGGKNQTNIELIDNMMDQISIKSQDWDPAQGDKVQMRNPPPHTVSREKIPYKFAGNTAEGWKEANPHASDMSAEFLTLGKAKYDIYCALCHGMTGHGDGQIAEKMGVKPRNLQSPEAKAYSDGRIYYAITAGYGVMGSYSSQITDANTRWAVVNYVRSLQKAEK